MSNAPHRYDMVKTGIRTSPGPLSGDSDEDELLLGEPQTLTPAPSNQSDGRHVRETSDRWSSPDDGSNGVVDLRKQSTSSTPHSEYADRVRSLQPLTATAELPGGSSSEEEPGVDKQWPSGTQLQLGVWDVINQEILDSFGVYGTRGLLDSEQKARKLAASGSSLLTMHSYGPGGLRPELDKQEALISLVAVQLLAACFTLPPEPTPGSLPSAFYYTRWKESSPSALSGPSCNLPDPRLISCLGLHARYRHTPAAGHHARNPSVIPAWPDLYSGPSREERLADEVCKRRRLRLQAEIQTSGATTAATGNGDYLFSPYLDGGGIDDGMTTSAKKCRCQRGFLQKGVGHGVMGWYGRYARPASSHRTPGSSGSNSITNRTNEGNTKSKYVNHWSLRPVLRVEAHPVFIQPVKDLVMKRWRAIRSIFVSPSPDRGRPRLESTAGGCTCASALIADNRKVGGNIARAGSGGVYEQQCASKKKEGLSNDRPPFYELRRAIPLSRLPKTTTAMQSAAALEVATAPDPPPKELIELARPPEVHAIAPQGQELYIKSSSPATRVEPREQSGSSPTGTVMICSTT